MADEVVEVSERGAVAFLMLNRPAVLNALDDAMVAQLLAAARRLAADERIRCVVLSGAGRGFMAGGDVLSFHRAGPDAPAVIAGLIEPFHDAVAILTAMPKPLVAAVHGPVAGAGISLMLVADLVVAADDAKFSLAYARLGTSPDGGATWALPRVVGLRKAMEIALMGDTLDAAEALRLSLVNRVVPAADLMAETTRLAERLAAGPTLAYARTKALLRASFDRGLPDQLAAEAEAFQASSRTRDFREGVAGFVEKRAVTFEGR